MKTKIEEVILNKLQSLPLSKKAEVLNFVDYLSTKNKKRKSQVDIYAYTARIVKEKKMKKLSRREIEAIVHEVRGVKT